ncbi:sugar kinase [Geothrix limicola]|uniref:Sugar kinase n=1 Tax=Geothrix limicola TaxID=2927978 RepID=A0ABQ5QC38_9BACT|nr:ROK family protein [Geothrix limicola]GLH71690.1 sugar kinase [Geothrix limicola]
MANRTLIGVDLGGTNIRAGRVENHRIVKLAARPTPAKAEADVVVADLVRSIEDVLSPEVSAIGIGVPSVVDVEQGIVYDVENIPSWREVALKRILEDRFQLPVRVNNDANCFALGEYHFGKGRGSKSLVGLIVGTGLGAGLVLDGRLYSGVNCGAGEIGSLPYRDHTYEYYVSGPRFQREHGRNGGQLYEAALRGEAEALQIFEAFGRDLGKAIALAIYAYDPDRILLGGSVSKAYPFFRETVWAELRTFAFQQSLKRLSIEVSEEPQIAILGAAALCLDVPAAISI